MSGLEDEEEHEEAHDEPWLVSYADLMTLLFGFFVLMYTFTSAKLNQDADRFIRVRKSVAKYFGGVYDPPIDKTVLKKIEGVFGKSNQGNSQADGDSQKKKQKSIDNPDSVAGQAPPRDSNNSPIEGKKSGNKVIRHGGTKQVDNQGIGKEIGISKEKELGEGREKGVTDIKNVGDGGKHADVGGIEDSKPKETKANVSDQSVDVQFDGQTLKVTFQSSYAFALGSADISEKYIGMLKEFITFIKPKKSELAIIVEGHTDDIPLAKGARFPSNWELSAARAGSVIRIFEEEGFPKDQMLLLGFGKTKPLLPNRFPDGSPIKEHQKRNRRVVIKVFPSGTNKAAVLLENLFKEDLDSNK